MWQKLYKRCKHTKTPYVGYQFVPKPTDALLDGFEGSRDLRLPNSYRSFVTLFGPGELAGLYRIAAPLPFTDAYDLATFDRNLHGEPEDRLLIPFGPLAMTDLFLYFASSGGGDYFGRKTDEVTDPDRAEFAIYRFDFPPFQRVASDFESWVEDYVMRPDSERGWEPEYRFRRFEVERSSL